MDAVDEKILRILAANAREKASVIGREVNLSVSAVTQRIRKLEDSGVLRQYTAVIDQKRLGNDIAAWMEICLEHPKYYDAFVEHINAMPNVLICHYLTGDFDF
ncbi:MAG: Lrp/AsnC family transcriptional regulator, partial [Oscillospiraceae bacterium]|nr:Lrp/AsnC family transcriptional regulator [Oscillospiraceae bacterium]